MVKQKNMCIILLENHVVLILLDKHRVLILLDHHGFLMSADLFRASRVLELQKQTVQYPPYQSIKTAKPNHANQPTT